MGMMKFKVSFFAFLLILLFDSWVYRYNVAHTGTYSGKNLPTLEKLRWRFKTNGTIYSTPAVVDNTVYFGSNDGYFYAVDLKAGELKWKFKTGNTIETSPAFLRIQNKKVSNAQTERIYFGSNDKNFYCLDARTGKVIWKFKVEGWLMSSPIIVDSIVYFGSGEGVLYAVSALNGNLVWKFQAQKAIYSSPAYSDGKIYFGSLDKNFYAVDSKTGNLIWIVSTEGMINSSPVVFGGTVFFGSNDGKLYAVDSRSGWVKWKFQIKGQITQTPAVDDKAIYFSSADGALYIVSHDGKLLWKIALDEVSLWSSPVVAGDYVYSAVNTATYSGIYKLNRRTGKMESAFDLPHRAFASPVIVDGVLLVGSKDGYLYAIE